MEVWRQKKIGSDYNYLISFCVNEFFISLDMSALNQEL